MRKLLAVFIAVSLSWVAYVRTDGFSPALIAGPLVTECSAPLTAEIEAILSQPFHYLDKGRQCFVFESRDGKYVLKFFNQKYLQVPWYGVFIEKEKEKRALRRHFYENSYEIAYRELGEEILYLHLGPSGPMPELSLTDKASRTYEVDLTDLPFVLQRKGIPFYQGLEAVYKKEGLGGLEREIDAFVSAISRRIGKNIADGDSDVEHNWGYVDGKIFHLDPGRLYYKKLSDSKELIEEWQRATGDFYRWLNAYHPDGAKYLTNQSAANLETTSSLPVSSNR